MSRAKILLIHSADTSNNLLRHEYVQPLPVIVAYVLKDTVYFFQTVDFVYLS